ncbi:hypothetical protein A374_14365, partial [Fictibacillus macauensis ZFHKF-1]
WNQGGQSQGSAQPGFPWNQGGQSQGGQNQHSQQAYPPGPPPTTIPSSTTHSSGQGSPSVYAVDPGAISPCLYQYVYLRLTNGQGFWAWLTYVGRQSVAGFRWSNRRWNYFGLDTNMISSFVCA